MHPTTPSDVCPRCHATPDPATGLCGCPAPATQVEPAADYSSGALVAQAESLFETYLAARLVRARRQLTQAKVALLRDPRNRARLEELRRTEQETRRLQAQLVEQARKVAEAKEQVRAGAATPTPETIAAQPTEDFRALQAARAEQAVSAAATQLERRSRPDDRDCPECARRLPGETTRCPCGYRFAADDVVAEPFLSEEELAALRHTVKSV